PPLVLYIFVARTAPTSIYTLSLHDALPILVDLVIGDHHHDRHEHAERRCRALRGDRQSHRQQRQHQHHDHLDHPVAEGGLPASLDRKSTRLNSSHVKISYAVFCLKKKTTKE